MTNPTSPLTIENISCGRVLLKLSGEVLSGENHFGIDPKACQGLAQILKNLKSAQTEIALVIGGGNIFRGVNLKDLGMARPPADQIGMLSTLINGIALQQALEGIGCPTRILSALDCPAVAETYTWRQAKKYLADGDIVLFVGGTGNPFFTTDTAAAMRASEIGANLFLKATKVDGIYNKDPLKYGDATQYPHLSYTEMLSQNLGVMDATSVALCRSSNIPIYVFNMELLKTSNDIPSLLKTRSGTLVSGA